MDNVLSALRLLAPVVYPVYIVSMVLISVRLMPQMPTCHPPSYNSYSLGVSKASVFLSVTHQSQPSSPVTSTTTLLFRDVQSRLLCYHRPRAFPHAGWPCPASNRLRQSYHVSGVSQVRGSVVFHIDSLHHSCVYGCSQSFSLVLKRATCISILPAALLVSIRPVP
jgi:hypothetical protein